MPPGTRAVSLSRARRARVMSLLYPPHRKWGPEKEGKTPYEMHREADYQTKEYLVAVETIKIMQEQLKICYLKNGPNHFEDCKDLRDKLWEKINTYNYGAPGPARSSSKYGIINPLGEGNERKFAGGEDDE